MKLQNNFTTPEQSKRLLELGLPADSADCYLQDESQDGSVYNNYFAYIIRPCYDKNILFTQEGILPCWSVGRLMEIINKCVERQNVFMLYTSLPLYKAIDFIGIFILTYEECIRLFDFSKLEIDESTCDI